jgi:hypothetical protein
MSIMVLTNVIRRGGVLIAAAVMIPFVALAASGCGAGTSTGDGRYDTKLWMRDLKEGAAYLPK